MASPQAEAIKQQLRAVRDALDPSGPPPTLGEMRASMESFAELATLPEGVTWEPVDAGGVPAIWAIPSNGAIDRVVLSVHGGGDVGGSAKIYERVTGHLANAVGCRVLNVDYRLAPAPGSRRRRRHGVPLAARPGDPARARRGRR